MTESEWFERDWPTDELRRQYNDRRLTNTRREHAFWRHWVQRLDVLSEPASREMLEEILAEDQWAGVGGEVIARLAYSNRLLLEDAWWLVPQMKPDSWAQAQIRALIIAEDTQTPPLERLQQTLSLRADWASENVLASLPSLDTAEAKEIINASSRPRAAKRRLIECIG